MGLTQGGVEAVWHRLQGLHRISFPSIRQLAPVYDAGSFVPHLAHEADMLPERQFTPCHVGKDALCLLPSFLKIGQLRAEFVPVEEATIDDVEVVERHAAPPAVGQGRDPPSIASRRGQWKATLNFNV